MATKTTTTNKSKATNGHSTQKRLAIQKTYKLYIGGAFPRTESGRFLKLENDKDELIANYCRASRKDFRNAVVAARKAQGGWAGKTAFLRSQILYRMAEMMESRRAQFEGELNIQGMSLAAAKEEVDQAIDCLVYYAGWADKFQQVFASVNPVSSSHFNFSMYEATGVVSAIAADNPGLLGLVALIAPVICGGNSIVILASEKFPISAITFAEVLNDSDLPGGVVNILTGLSSELHSHFASHMDVNAVIYAGDDAKELVSIQEEATRNIKRVIRYTGEFDRDSWSPYPILDTQEVKTTWHPVGM